MAGASGLHLLTILTVILTPLGFPYSANPSAPSPQRIHVFVSTLILPMPAFKNMQKMSF
jgi:hypothetical protein